MNCFELNVSNLKFVAVPTSTKNFQNHSYHHDALYQFWLNSWSDEFAKNAAPNPAWKDHFQRADVCLGLFHKDAPLASLLCTFLNFSSIMCRNSEYLKCLEPNSKQVLLESEIQKAMTMEYLISSPEAKKNSIELSLSKLLLTLSTHFGESENQDCNIGMPIDQTSVKKSLVSLGGIEQATNIKKYGYTLCLLTVPTKPRQPCTDGGIDDLAHYLWRERIDCTENKPSTPLAA